MKTTTHHTKETESNGIKEAVENLAEDARALVTATADLTEDKVIQARKRLNAALAAARDACELAQDRAIDGAKLTDKAIRANPYQALGVAFGVGALVGFLLSRRTR